jgi:hypothetical protein
MKTTAKDIWAVPPGGFAAKPARRWIRPTIAATLVLSLGVGGGSIYASMQKSTAVTTQSAIAEFRAGSSGDAEQSSRARADTKERSGADRAARRERGANRRSDAGAVAAGSATGTANESTTSSDSSGAEAATTQQRARASATTGQIGPPEEGVYTWEMDGVERGPGVERRLPKRSHRIITHEGGNNWEEHHIFSEQKEQWLHLGMSRDGVAVSAVRNRVVMGPVEVDRTVTYDPPAFVSRFPFGVGQTWKGSWEGKTRGHYRGKTLDHTTLTIGGEEVEVWVTEVVMEMTGEVEGTAVTRSWVADDYNMVVRQYQETDLKAGPSSYYSQWEGQVLSLQPQR